MKRRRFTGASALVALVVAGALAVACGGSTSASNVTLPAGSGPVAIEIAETDDGFEPRAITVERGQLLRVTFANKGKVIHNLHIAGAGGTYGGAGDFVIGQPVVMPGAKATGDWKAPDQPGTIPFRCDAHPSHTGVITVR